MLRNKRTVVTILILAFLGIVLVFNARGDNQSKQEQNAATTTEKSKEAASNNRPRDIPTVHEDYCTWSPSEQDDCKRILASRLLQQSTSVPRRWLFLGDSTMAQIWTISSLNEIMVDFGVSQINEVCSRRFVLEPVVLDECNLNQQYDLPTVTTWKPPDWEHVGEGPADVDHRHECFGCHNCVSHFPRFTLVDESRHCRANQRLAYGGFVAIPYARDVVLQTPSMGTTQENILQYIDQHWNNDVLHEEFGGHPVCVVRTGFHDIAIPHTTQSKYVANVQWYLQLLQKQCSHVIWLQNTAPLAKEIDPLSNPHKYSQTVERVREYDLAVYEMVRQNLPGFVTTMDVFEASRDWQHSDNIHLDNEWNRALGQFFVKLATKVGA